MKLKSALAAVLLAAFFAASLVAQETASPTADLKALVTKIQDKLRAGQRSAKDLEAELAAFDALREKYRSTKTDEAAQIALVQASLYGDVLGDAEKAKSLIEQMKKDYQGLAALQHADRYLASLERTAKAKDTQTSLVGKPAPNLTFTWSSRPGLKSLADLKGKVVVLDFWATWCGPCVASFPQVRELTEHYKGSDVEVLGVTSLQGYVIGLEPNRIDTRDNPKKEMELMTDYIKAKSINWTIVFSEEPVFNPDYGINGIPHMAIIAPDGTVRHSGLHPAMPHADKVEKIDALLKEFKKPSPAAK